MKQLGIALCVLFSSQLASAQEPAAAPERLGLTLTGRLAHFSPNKVHAFDGETEDFPSGLSERYELLALGVRYDVKFLEGLHFGLDLPFVSHAIEVGSFSGSKAGLGDVSLYAGYMTKVETLDVGGRLRLKAGSGTSPYDSDLADGEVPTGSGTGNLQASVFGATDVSGAKLSLEAGYLVVMTTVLDASTKLNPGDYVFADLGVGYEVQQGILPRLHVLYASSGNAKVTVEDPLGGGSQSATIEDSGSQWLALAIDCDIAIDEMLTANVGYGTPLDAAGFNLPYGYVLSGKNTKSGVAMLNLGITAKF